MNFISFIVSFLLVLSAYAEEFHFSQGLEDWGTWGDGIGVFDEQTGNQGKGSIKLSTDFGEVQTLHYHWDNLIPALYKVTAYVRALKVQKSKDKVSFWHFHDANGETTVFNDLNGSYGWRKIEYTINVPKKDLSIWFRLKTPGVVWIDDFELTKVSVQKNLTISSPITSTPLPQRKVPILGQKKELKIPGKDYFETSAYYPLKVGDWSGFDRIEMDIHNPDNEYRIFYLSLLDDQSNNYWSQVNHKTHLSPGWNKLSFSLSQFVGERGSHRHLRGLNLSRMKKAFVVVEPDARIKKNRFFIQNIILKTYPHPAFPKDMLAYDFTSQKDFSINPFIKVTSQDTYDELTGFGFVNPEFWRVEDSKYASDSLRYTIGIQKGSFKVKVPNGKYQIQLELEKLGYWDVPFWKRRMISINGNVVMLETRNNAGDYLKDYLQFENIVPSPDKHPFDLYHSMIFKPLEKTVNVTNGYLNIEFDGDASAISLNRLLIWKAGTDQTAFFESLRNRDKLEFDWLARPIASQLKERSPEISLIAPNLKLGPDDSHKEVADKIIFQGGSGERPFQIIQIKSAGTVKYSWKISDILSASGVRIPSQSLEVKDIVSQYVSPDLNHETYFISGKYLKTLDKNEIEIPRGTHYLWIQLPISKVIAPGKYSGEITFSGGKIERKFSLDIKIMPYSLPQINFPVGFFGLDPIPHSYFESPDLLAYKKQYRKKALQLLGSSGFTTFSGLPEVKVKSVNGRLALDLSELEELFHQQKDAGLGNTVYSYGGQFPQNLIDESQKPYEMDSETYHRELSYLLKGYLENPAWPQIVHTFSDEAGGYSDRISEDTKTGSWLKKIYPFLKIGGFSSMSTQASGLNKLFDIGFYSGLSKSNSVIKNWGRYNGAPGNLDDPRFAFGPGLYTGREMGLSQYLEWHSSGFNNYPYFDLDGRESDVSMYMPSSDGSLRPTIRFELATEGLNSYRKMVLLKQLLEKRPAHQDIRKWLKQYENQLSYYSDPEFLKGKNFDFQKFHHELNNQLSKILE